MPRIYYSDEAFSYNDHVKYSKDYIIWKTAYAAVAFARHVKTALGKCLFTH